MLRWPFHRRRSVAALALLIATMLLAAACATAQGVFRTTPTLQPVFQSQAASQSQPPRVAPTSAPAPALLGSTAPDQPAAARAAGAPAASPAAQASPANQSGQTGPESPASTLPLDRMVMRTARLSVEVGDVEQALARTREIAQAGGGFVSASNTRVEKGQGGQDRTVADLTLQVRTDALDNSLQALRALGKVDSETSSSQDVTEEYVDLDANLRNLQASETAILRLMDRAERIEDVIALQRELTNVRGQIERIQGRKQYLERRTDMATLNLSLHLPAADASPPSGAFDPLAIARRGWLASLSVLRGAAEVLIVAIAFSWWLVPLVGLGAYLWLHRRPRPAAPAQN